MPGYSRFAVSPELLPSDGENQKQIPFSLLHALRVPLCFGFQPSVRHVTSYLPAAAGGEVRTASGLPVLHFAHQHVSLFNASFFFLDGDVCVWVFPWRPNLAWSFHLALVFFSTRGGSFIL